MHSEAIFTIFGQEVYLYGICMAVGIICCFLFLMFTMERKNFNEETIDKGLLFGIVATGIGVLMAAVFQGLYDYIEDPSGGFSLSGLTFYGGLIGGVASFLIFWNLYIFVIAPRAKSKLLQSHMNAGLCDALPFVPIAIGIAHAFGRLGCTFAGCCYGASTDAWFGMVFTTTSGHAVVPTQLFECIFLVLLTIVMAVLYFRFHFNLNMSVYCFAYGIWRFLIEYVRDDHRGSFVAGLTPSQFWAIIMVILGVAYIFAYKYLLKRMMKHPELQPSVRKKPAKEYVKFDRTAIVVCSLAAAAVILAILGVSLNYVNAGTSTSSHKIFTAEIGYMLGSETLSDISGYAAMSALAYIALAVTIINAALYAAYRNFNNKTLKIASTCVAGLLFALSVAALLAASVNAVGGVTSYVIRPAAGAWLLCLGGILGSVSVFIGCIGTEQTRPAAEKKTAEENAAA